MNRRVACAFLLQFALSAPLSLAQQAGGEGQPEMFDLQIPFLGQKIQIDEKYKIPLLITVGLFCLLYYAPQGFARLRESMGKAGVTARSLELERIQYEILKTRYEIEVLKKEHGITLSEANTLDGKAETVATQAEESGTRERAKKIRHLIQMQIDEIDRRKRFVFRRVGAFFLDYFFLSVLLSFVFVLVPVDYVESPFFTLVLAGAFALYFISMWAARGATIGKMIVGLRIVRLDGRPMTAKDGIVRYLLWSTGVSFLWGLVDKKKQALHDKIAKTVVVKVRGSLEPQVV